MAKYHFEGATPEALARAMVKRRPMRRDVDDEVPKAETTIDEKQHEDETEE